MVGIKGSYEFTLIINGKNNIIKEEDLDHYTLIEEVGGSLPTFELAFSTRDGSLLEALNEGSTFSARVVDATGKEKAANLFVVSAITRRFGQSEYRHTIRGTTHKEGYNLNQRIILTDNITSVDAIRAAASKYFQFETDCQSSDRMNWIQHNISDRRFIYDCYMHCDLKGSFPILAITHDDRFLLRDAKKLAGKEPRAEFGYNSGFTIDPEYEIRNNSSFLNSQGAYGIEQVESVLGEHRSFSEVKITQPVSNLLTRGKLNRMTNTATRRFAPVSRSENMHENYWEAHRRNRASLAAYSTTEVRIGVRNRVVPINAGDLAMFKDDENGIRAIESYSGLYFVSKVAVTLARRNIVTGVVLTRENINAAQGTLR